VGTVGVLNEEGLKIKSCKGVSGKRGGKGGCYCAPPFLNTSQTSFILMLCREQQCHAADWSAPSLTRWVFLVMAGIVHIISVYLTDLLTCWLDVLSLERTSTMFFVSTRPVLEFRRWCSELAYRQIPTSRACVLAVEVSSLHTLTGL